MSLQMIFPVPISGDTWMSCHSCLIFCMCTLISKVDFVITVKYTYPSCCKQVYALQQLLIMCLAECIVWLQPTVYHYFEYTPLQKTLSTVMSRTTKNTVSFNNAYTIYFQCPILASSVSTIVPTSPVMFDCCKVALQWGQAPVHTCTRWDIYFTTQEFLSRQFQKSPKSN